MKIRSPNFEHGATIPAAHAFGRIDPDTHMTLSDNRSPALAFTDVPEGARSLALICRDPDVPSRGDDVNKEGRLVPADLPRVEFIHWLLWNIPAHMRELPEGSQAKGVTTRGKAGPDAPSGMRHGINDYTGWFADDAEMAGDYYGYDGPCPPWNDSILHHYEFTLYALDVSALELEGTANVAALREAMKGHVLAQATLMGTYSLNPDLG